mgnify:CR=1 FL=1
MNYENILVETHGKVDILSDMTRFDAERLRILVERHLLHTGSARARALLDDWGNALKQLDRMRSLIEAADDVSRRVFRGSAETAIVLVKGGRVEIPGFEPSDFADVDRIVIIACGTAAYAGLVGKYAIEKWARIPVDVELSHAPE